MNLVEVNNELDTFASLVHNQTVNLAQKYKVGVDLGTANVVISIVNEDNEPVGGISSPANVVSDGIVVDYVGAVEIVKKLKRQMEEHLNAKLTQAATAVPPGTTEGDRKSFQNVLESAFFDLTTIIDEPTAASDVLGLLNGAMVDVGGGTTGINILQDGKVVYTADEPTGGTHMSLVLAGYFHLSYEEAEQLKKDKKREQEVFSIIKPVIEKMASIVQKHIKEYQVERIYLVGGASSFEQFTDVFTKQIGIETIKPNHPLFITPLGIARNSKPNRGG